MATPSQALHTRSEVGVGATCSTVPGPQAVLFLHAVCAGRFWYWAGGLQVEQTRSLELVGAAEANVPGWQVRTGLHSVWPASSWYCCTPSHAVHSRSLLGVDGGWGGGGRVGKGREGGCSCLANLTLVGAVVSISPREHSVRVLHEPSFRYWVVGSQEAGRSGGGEGGREELDFGQWRGRL